MIGNDGPLRAPLAEGDGSKPQDADSRTGSRSGSSTASSAGTGASAAHHSLPSSKTTPRSTGLAPPGNQPAAASPAAANIGDGGDSNETSANAATSGNTTARSPLQTGLIVTSLALTLFLVALDMTIITTAAPVIASQFGSGLGYTWVGSAYLLANAAAVPSWGKVSDIWGRKPILLIAVAVFWVGSLLSGLAQNMGWLIAARTVQGVGGGGIVVLVNICIGDLFSMRTRGVFYGVMGIVWAVASAVGPIVGGVFTSKVTWRWNFFINLPISGVAMLVLVFMLRLHNPRTPVREGLKAVDWVGSAAVVGATVMVLLGLEFGGVVQPWGSTTVVCLLVFGLVTFAIFIANEIFLAPYPVVPPHLFATRSNLSAFGTTFFHGTVFMAGSYFLPLYFQTTLGADALRSGIYLLPYSMSLSVVSTLSGVIIRKTGRYVPNIVTGTALTVLGFGLFINLSSNPPSSGSPPNWAKIVIYQIIAGIGVGPNFQAPLIALQASLPPRDVASVTATFAFIRQLAASVSVVIGGVVIQNQMGRHRDMLLASGLPVEVVNGLAGDAAGAGVGVLEAISDNNGTGETAARRAYGESIRIMWIVYVALAAAGFIVSLGIGATKLSKEHEETKTGLAAMKRRGRGLRETRHDSSGGHRRVNSIDEKRSAEDNGNRDVEKAVQPSAGHPS